MQKQKDQANRYSALFADTEFVHSKMNYVTLIDRQSSKIPTVLPFDDETITLQEIQNQISMIIPQSGSNILDLPEQSSIYQLNNLPSLKSLKCKHGRKKINGQQVEYSSKSGTIDMKKVIESLEKCPQTQGEKCKICCIMIGKKSDALHLQFKWKSQQDAIQHIIKAINQNYASKLTQKDISWYGINFEKSKEDQVTYFKLHTKKCPSLQEYIFESNNISFVGVEIIVNRFSFEKANHQTKVHRSTSSFNIEQSENIFRIQISKEEIYNLEYQYYKNYQIQELFSMLELQNPESKGLKVGDCKYSPYNLIYCLGEHFKKEPKFSLDTKLTKPEEILMKQLEKLPVLTSDEMKKIEEESNYNKIKKPICKNSSTISALRLFCSDCNYQTKHSISKFYHIISLFLKNYQTHYISYLDASISTRFTKTLQQQILKRQIYKGNVYRRLGYQLKCSVGDILQFNNFIICSKNKNIAFSQKYFNSWQQTRTNLMIHSQTGRVVGRETNFEGLEQIIFLPYRKFQVVERKANKKQKSIDLRLLQYTEQQPEPPKQNRHANFLLWIDDKPKQGKKVLDYLFKQKIQVISYQLPSTEQFQNWIHQNARFLQQNKHNIVIITNMSRQQQKKFNQYAGTDTISLAKKQLPFSSVILYIGDLARAYNKLRDKNIDPSSIFVTQQSQKMVKYLVDKLRQPPPQKKPSRGIKSIQKQNWQDYFSILETSKNLSQQQQHIVVPQPTLPKTNKIPASIILKSQKAYVPPNKIPTAKQQMVENKKYAISGKEFKSSIYGQSKFEPQKQGNVHQSSFLKKQISKKAINFP